MFFVPFGQYRISIKSSIASFADIIFLYMSIIFEWSKNFYIKSLIFTMSAPFVVYSHCLYSHIFKLFFYTSAEHPEEYTL